MTQIVLTGLPVLLFITFSITVFLFSLIAALLIGLLVAILFTLFMVGVALLVVLPTIFMTTFTASFLFLWGLGGYYTLKWYEYFQCYVITYCHSFLCRFNEGDSPTPEGTSIGDKINNLTGGRMSWLTDGARKKQDDAHTDSDESPRLHSSDDDSSRVTGEKGSRRAPRKLAETSKNTSTESTDNKHKRVDKGTKGTASAASTTSNTANTSDGAVGNDTGA